jgi:DNA primase
MNLHTHYIIQEIKKNLPILDVAEEFGLKLKQSGRSYFTLCPFHGERNASCSLVPNSDSTKDSFKCFGCHARGDQIDFYALLKGITNKAAIKELGNRFGLFNRKLSAADKIRIEKQALHREFSRNEKQNFKEVINNLSNIVRSFNDSTSLIETMEDAETLAPIYHLQPYYQYLLDCMLGDYGDVAQIEAYLEAEGVVARWNSQRNN